MKGYCISVALVSALTVGCAADGINTADVSSITGAIGASSANTKSTATVISAGMDAHKSLTMTDADVKALGLQGIAESDKKAKIATKGKYANRLNKLTAKLKNEDGLKLNFKVYTTPEINAFASPDGSIRVYSGLMDLMTDDELRYVLGHEIGHVKLGHSLSAYRAQYMAQAGRKGLSATNSVAGNVAGSNLGGLIENAFNAQYSQAAEREADDYALAFSKKYKYNAKAAVSALQKLAKLSGDKSSLFSSHPAPSERAQRLSEQIEKK